MTAQDPHGVTTGFQANRHCWKCFKENEQLTLIDDKPMNLCKGCLYTLKQLTQWLDAYGLKIKQVQYAMDLSNDASQGKGEDRVQKGKDSKNGKKAPEESGALSDTAEKEIGAL